jgi:Plasmid pRiA4b ORF-3-like protein
MPSKTKQPPQLGGLAYQLKISLVDVEPPIWRRILLTDNTNPRALHLIVQEAMGWQSCHLFEFEVDEIRYGEDLDDDFDDGEARPAKSVRIGDLGLGEGDAFIYLYDFGDNWVHEVRIESVSPVERGAAYPRCLGGERRCPPEDCGGVPGYQSILSALRSPSHPERSDWLESVGPNFDAESFDVAQTDARLREEHAARPRRRKRPGVS